MSRNRATLKLRTTRGKYYCVDVYLPGGKRTTVSFGTANGRTEGEIFVAFGKWIDLYREQPHKVLSYSTPYEAVEQILNPTKAPTVGELLVKYDSYAQKTLNHGTNRNGHSDLAFIKRARQFLKPYKDWPVSEFGPDELHDIQVALVGYSYKHGESLKRYTRRGINDTIDWIRRIWKWGMGRGFVTAEQAQGLEEIKSLRMGSTDAPDNSKRKRVTEEEFQKVTSHLGSVVADMLKMIWLTGMRPNEVCNMRPYDILFDDQDCWLYIPGRDKSPVGKHKTARFERVKVIPLTSECQEILKPRMKNCGVKEYIFSPKESMKEFYSERSVNRKTPLSCGNLPGSNRKENPMIRPGVKYEQSGLRRACKRACLKAGVEEFNPYDLRRTTATRVRSIFGKEAARVLLGHTKVDTTQVYLLEEVQESIRVAKMLAIGKETPRVVLEKSTN